MEQKVDNTDFEKDNGLKILKEAKKRDWLNTMKFKLQKVKVDHRFHWM